MVRYRARRVRHGTAAAAVAFVAGWAVTALVASTAAFNEPRWQSTLWVYLGAHFLELAEPATIISYQYLNPVEIADVPTAIYLVPIAAVGVAAAYTCHEIRSSRLKHNVSNALGAGMGYFLAGLLAVVVTDMRPNISVILIAAVVIGGGIWIGSTVVRTTTGGLPFIGVTSLGTVAIVGLLVIGGGATIARALAGLIGISFGVSSAVGFVFGVSRQLERRGGRRDASLSRTKGLKLWLEDHWKTLLVVGVIVGALAVGLTGDPVI